MARIVVISADPITRADAIRALDGEHEVVALASPWESGRRGRVRGRPADALILDAALLFSPAAREHLGAVPRGDLDASPVLRAQAPAVLVLVEPGQERRIIPCFEAGADDYVVKPIAGADLLARIDRICGQRGAVPDSAATETISISDDGRIISADDVEHDDVLANLGRYQVRGVLGRGGYGVVYRARDIALGRDVALKVLPREMHDNTEAVTRFLRESTAISRLDHPNIVKFYEMGSFRGRLYFTMEIVEGRTLKAIADDEAPMPVARAARYVAGITKALAALDSLGLVHRDVKPENVLLTRDDQVKLIDFGLVKIANTAAITSQDDVLGTPYFMAPEYIRAPGVPDIRYDLYALGITFFHLLTAEYPFDGKNAAHVMEKHLRSPAPRVGRFQPGIPPAVEAMIARLLQKDPDARYQSPADVLADLKPLTVAWAA